MRIFERYSQGTSVSAVQRVIESKSRLDTATRSEVSLSSQGRSSTPERKLLPPFSLPSQSRRTFVSYSFGFGRFLIAACRNTASSVRCEGQQCSNCLSQHTYDILSGAGEWLRPAANAHHLAAVNASMPSPSHLDRDLAGCRARAADPEARLAASAGCGRSSRRIACTKPCFHAGPSNWPMLDNPTGGRRLVNVNLP